MRRLVFLGLCAAGCLGMAGGAAAAEVVPLPAAHAHNDYEHARPLLDALERGPMRNPNAPTVAFEGRVFPTDSGKARLLTELPPDAAGPDGAFPLLLHALSTPESQSSQWSPAEPDAPAEARVHPDVAGGISDGARATLRSALGAITVTVVHDGAMRRDVVVLPKGGSLGRGRCANAITRARLTDAGEGAALYEEPVRLEALAVSER